MSEPMYTYGDPVALEMVDYEDDEVFEDDPDTLHDQMKEYY